MPTALERAGDFSQTFNSTGQMRWIRDPNLAAQGLACNVNTGGPGCFPDNKIPANRINAIGLQMLNLFPLPNATDPSGNRQYNYTYQNVLEKPRNDQVARVDYNINRNTTFYTRVQFGNEVNSRGANAFLGAGTGNGGNAGWPQFNTSYEVGSLSMVSTLLHTFSSSTVGEVTVGRNWAEQLVSHVSQADLDRNDRRVVLGGLPQFFPSANPQYLVPQISYGGTNALPNTRGVGVADRYPFNASNIIWNYSGNLSKVAGRHNMKTGIFYEHTARPAPRAAVFNGNYNFDGNASNPFDTNLGFANALLGSINSYTESTAKPYAEGRFNQVEGFVQDNWRVTSRLTLDFGARFYYLGPTFVAGQDVSYFDSKSGRRPQAPLLFQPVCPNNAATCAGNVRQARNPLTGQILNNTYIDKLVPGSGDFYEGMVVAKQTVYNGKFLIPAPRVGFAWNVFGDGKTSVRGGWGVFYDRYQDDFILSLVEQPPLMDTRTTSFTTIADLQNSQLIQSPRGVTGFADFKAPTVYNWSIGVQQALPWNLIADVAYVGNAGRNQPVTKQINDLPYGTLLLPQNADPTNGGQPIATNYLRPYRGYGGIGVRDWNGYNDYHSIQVAREPPLLARLRLRRQLHRHEAQGARDLRSLPLRGRQQGAQLHLSTRSRPHSLVINYNYELPKPAPWNNLFSKMALDGWQISGITITAEPEPRRLHLRVHRRADQRPVGQRRSAPRDARVRPEPAEQRADVRPSVQDRVHQARRRPERSVLPGYLDQRRVQPAGVHQPRHHVLQELRDGNPLAAVPRRALQRLQLDAVCRRRHGRRLRLRHWRETDTNFGRITGVRANSNRIIQLGLRFRF